MTRIPNARDRHQVIGGPKTPGLLPLESGPQQALREYGRRLGVLTGVALAIAAGAAIVVLIFFVAFKAQVSSWATTTSVSLAIALATGTSALFRERRKVSYRVLYDSPVNERSKETGAHQWRVTLRTAGALEYENPSLVVVRVRNDGRSDLAEDDWDRPLTFEFPGRQVASAKVRHAPQLPDKDIAVSGEYLSLPPFRLDKGADFQLMAILSGTGSGVDATGAITGTRGGGIRADRPPGRSRYRWAIVTAGVLVAVAGLVVGLLVAPGTGHHETGAPSTGCASGQLTVYGATDFAPLLAELAQAYVRACPGVQITVAPTEDTAYALASLERGKAGSSTLVVAEGTPTFSNAGLVRRPLAIETYSVIVNRATGARSLTTAQIRGIYDGAYTNWRQLGGSDLPITSVGRGAGSATRIAFDQLILGVQEPSPPGPCLGSPGRCTENSTLALLSLVNATPGAIGYAPTTTVASASHSRFRSLSQVSVNAITPTTQNVLNGAYDFWQIASLYSLGIPPAGSLSASFTSYLGTSASQGILQTQGAIPCGSSALCG